MFSPISCGLCCAIRTRSARTSSCVTSSGLSRGAAMTNIRLLGVAIALAIVAASFFYLRGEKWSRINFLLALAVSAILLFVSIEPNAVNVFPDALNLGDFNYGRLLSLLVMSNIGLIFLALYTRSKVDGVKHLFDRSLRAAAAEAVEPGASGPRPEWVCMFHALNATGTLDRLRP